MKTYLITYESTYQPTMLINKIKQFQYWARPTNQVWLVKSTSDRNSIYNYLLTGTFYYGKLLIIEVTNDWIAKNLSNEVVQWMQGGL